jgi:hypothetical protein
MKRSLLLLLPAIVALFMYSCKRGDDNSLTAVTPGSYASLDDIFERTKNLSITQSIKVASGGEIITKSGTHVIFQKDCFQSFSGAIVTGSVDVKVTDWLKKGDMAFGRVLPVSNNEALVTSGQVLIEATQNGVPIRLRKGYYAFVLFPQYGASIVDGTDSLYLGRKVAGSVNTVNWYTIDTAGRTFQLGSTDTLVLATDSLRHIAASHFLPVSDYANFTVKVNTPIELEQTLVVALMDGVRSVYPVASAVNNTISAQHIPVQALHLAVMGVNKGVFYAGILPIPGSTSSSTVPMTDSVYTVDIKQWDPQNFRLEMNKY